MSVLSLVGQAWAAGLQQDEQEQRELPAVQQKAAVQFTLNRVIFPDSAFLSPAELDAVASVYVGKVVSFNDITKLVEKINQLYTQKNITTALAVLSNQKIIDGQIHIDLVEAKLGQVTVNANYTDTDFIRRQLHLETDQTLDLRRTDEEITRFNRIFDVQIAAQVSPGAAPGLTDLVIDTRESDPYQIKVFADNQSAPSLGRDEVGINASAAGLIGNADLLAVMLGKSAGALNGSVTYGIGVGQDDAQVNTSLSRNNISIISGTAKVIDIKGVTDRAALGWNQPYLATQEWLLASDFTYARAISTNTSANELISKFDINTFSTDITVSQRGDGMQWFGQLEVDYGQSLSLTDQHNDYFVFSGNMNGNIFLTDTIYMALRSNGQFTKKTALPPSALLQIGGEETVRGYDTGFATGTDGFVLSAELHDNLGDGWDAQVFVDHGQVGSDGAPKVKITGTGLGVSRTWNNIVAKISYGHADNIVRAEQSHDRLDAKIEVRFF